MARRAVFGLAAVGAAGALALAACGGSSSTTPTSTGFNKAVTSVVNPSTATTVVFHLNQPFADFNYVVAFPQTAPVPPSKDTGANYQKHPMSTGPYKFASYQLNKQYTLVRNPQ